MSLVARVLLGTRWTTLAMATNVAFNLCYTAAIARLLPPAAFGLVAMAQIAIGFLSYFAQLGVSPALVQKPELTERDIRTALAVSVTFNVALFLTIWMVAPFAGGFFGNPQVAPVLRGLSFTFLLGGFSAISLGLLRRRLEFKRLALVEILAYTVGYGALGIGAALMGFGVWSLVFAAVGQEFVALLGSYILAKPTIRPLFAWKEAKHFISYGSKYSIIGFLEYLGANIDSLLLGRWYGDSALGIYNRAQMLAKLPMYHLSTAVTKVLFPVLSGAQSDKTKLAEAYLAGLALIGSLASAVSLALASASADAVLTLLGPNWKDAIIIVEIAALAVPFATLTRLSGIMCDAQGLLRPKLAIQVATLLVLAGAIVMSRDQGAIGFAMAVLIAEVFRFTLYLLLHIVVLPIGAIGLGRAGGAILFSSIITWLSVSRTADLIHPFGLPVLSNLIIEVAVGSLAYLMSLGIAWWWLRRMPAFMALKNSVRVIGRIEYRCAAVFDTVCRRR